MEATAKRSDIQKFRLEEGDVIITKDSESWDDIGIPSYVAHSMSNVICGYHLTHLKPDECLINGKYLYYFLESDIGSHHFHTEANGVTRYGLSVSGIKEAPITVPPKDQQSKIVEFLDRETERINNLVNKKKELIELLREKRRSLAVDKLSNKVDYTEDTKSTGIEWLDEIPESWDVSRISNLFEIENGSTPKSTEESYWEGSILWATPDDLKDEETVYLNSTGRKITEEGLDACGASLVPKNSILISTRAPIGHLGIAGSDITTNQGCKSLVFIDEQNNPLYFYYQLSAAIQKLKSLGMGSTYDELNTKDLKSVRLAVPPSSVQDELAREIQQGSTEIRSSINKIQSSIDLLEELKSTLITDTVTGQIDVRGEV
jgi:type I restriction enzyme S subunit